VDGNEKMNFTAVAGITASIEKIPLQFIAKGKSKTTAKNFGDIGENWATFSEKGWSTEKTIQQYLWEIRHLPQYAEKKGRRYVHQLHVILDVYSVHRKESVKQYARRLNIVLHFIPAGQTDQFQPLDRTVFGVLKAIARRLYREFFEGKAEEKVSKQLAARFLKAAWAEVKPSLLTKAWSLYWGYVPEDTAE
jgi:hypothetical protein